MRKKKRDERPRPENCAVCLMRKKRAQLPPFARLSRTARRFGCISANLRDLKPNWLKKKKLLKFKLRKWNNSENSKLKQKRVIFVSLTLRRKPWKRALTRLTSAAPTEKAAMQRLMSIEWNKY